MNGAARNAIGLGVFDRRSARLGESKPGRQGVGSYPMSSPISRAMTRVMAIMPPFDAT